MERSSINQKQLSYNYLKSLVLRIMRRFRNMKILDYAQVWTPAKIVLQRYFTRLSLKEFFGSFHGSGTTEWNDFIQLSVDFLFSFDQFDRVLIAQEKSFRQPEITCQP